jgi:hypothetical protein
MPNRCANPNCQFDYYSMRAICSSPDCLETPPVGCGRHFRSQPDGSAMWLCCYCAAEYEPGESGALRLAPDPAAFVWRWQMERGEASIAHEI